MSRAGLKFTIVIALLSLFLTPPAVANVSVNVPSGHWSYDAVDKLKGLGFINSDMRGTTPWTRVEVARLIVEAEEGVAEISSPEEEGGSSGRNEIIRAILDRLKSEFKADLDEVSATGGVKSYLKPIEDVYLH